MEDASLRRPIGAAKGLRIFTAMVVAFGLLTGRAMASSEANFWSWFTANESRLFTFESDQVRVFDDLSKELRRVNGDLTFEFGPVKGGKREFVISAGGIRSAFPAVEALYGAAPPLQRWVWVKYRPRRLPINDLEYGGKKIRADDVRYLLAKDGDKVGIVLFFDGYSEKKKSTFGQIGYLFLDEALGEYAMETQVGFVEFQPRSAQYFERSRPLVELPAQFDHFSGRKEN
jgi:hypothetical protein